MLYWGGAFILTVTVEPKGSQFDNPTFYHKILELIEEPNWKNEVLDILCFYNQ